MPRIPQVSIPSKYSVSKKKNTFFAKGDTATIATDSSFSKLVHIATEDIFDTSMSTINTSTNTTPMKDMLHIDTSIDENPSPQKQDKPETRIVVHRADPDGVVLADDYPHFDDEEQNMNVTANRDANLTSIHTGSGNNITSPDDSLESTCFDSDYQSQNSRRLSPSQMQEQHELVITNLKSIKNLPQPPNPVQLNRRKDRRNKCCWYWIFFLILLLLGIAAAGTTVFLLDLFGNDGTEQLLKAASSSGQDDTESIVNVDSEVDTWAPTFEPTFYPTPDPSSFPSDQPSDVPSDIPSAFPSDMPSTSPTFIPTLNPTTQIPTVAPSQKPTFPPTEMPSPLGPTETPSLAPSWIPSSIPSQEPTKIPTRPPVDLQSSHYYPFLSQVVSNVEALTDVNTPQGRALEWMDQEDEVELDVLRMDSFKSETEIERVLQELHQRFALITLDFALHGQLDQPQWSFPKLDVCLWLGVECNSRNEVTGVNYARQNLTGTVPPELGLLTNLVRLDIAQNNLKGTLDPIYKLQEAKEVYVFENHLSGRLKRDLEAMSSLRRLMIGKNKLSGTFPPLHMEKLEWFVGHHNHFNATIPSSLRLDSVRMFDIGNNKLTGTIPQSLAELALPAIKHFDVSMNRLNGTVPENFVNLGSGRVHQIMLNDNMLTGGFPTNFSEVKFLNNVDISNNLFTRRLGKMCHMSVFEFGEVTELRADCRICNCDRLCRTCHDHIDYLYQYDDDDWQFDDDTEWEEDDDDDDGAAATDEDEDDEEVETGFVSVTTSTSSIQIGRTFGLNTIPGNNIEESEDDDVDPFDED